MSVRKALLVATRHSVAPLPSSPTSTGDLEQLAITLANPEIGSFDVSSVVDQTVQQLRLAISRACRDVGRADTLLLYYTGGGLMDNYGRLFLEAVDTELDLLSATGLDSRFLLDELSNSRARAKVVVLDCNHAGAILREVSAPRDVAILASAGPVQYAFEADVSSADQSNAGTFTTALVEGLQSGQADLDGDGEVTVDELFSYTRRRVELMTAGAQTPRLFNLLEKSVTVGTVARPVFLSYSRSDADFTSKVAGELIAGGHRVWMDTGEIVGGDDWVTRISAALQQSKLVLAVLTPEALASPWVRRELGYARASGKPLLPLVHKHVQLPAWYELQFGEIQRLDLAEQTSELESAALLRSVSRALLSGSRGL